MYRGPREYKKQINREQKTFRLKRYNFFWHHNPDLFENSVKKRRQKPRILQNSDELYQRIYNSKIRTQRLRRRKDVPVESPEDIYLPSNPFEIPSAKIKSKRIKNRLMKNSINLDQKDEALINFDFSDDRFIISQPVRNRPQRSRVRLSPSSDADQSRLEQFAEITDQKKRESLSSSSKEVKTSKKQKNMFKTPQMYSNIIQHSSMNDKFEDQQETVKKNQNIAQCNDLFRESPRLRHNDLMIRNGAYDIKSPIPNSQKMPKLGNFKGFTENVPYETPRAEFGVNKVGDQFEQPDSMFGMKKDINHFQKSPLFPEAKLQNLKTTTKKYNYSSKNFDFLNPEQTKSPNMSFKHKMVEDTPENGFLKVNNLLMEKNLDFMKISAKDLDDYVREQKEGRHFIDTSIQPQKSEPFGEKFRKFSDSKQTETIDNFQQFVKKTDFSKILKYGNMREGTSAFSLIKAVESRQVEPKIQTPKRPEAMPRLSQEDPLNEPQGSAKKGCFCKQTECLKNYCSCFKAGIFCSSICECKNCENHENSERREKKLRSIALKSQSCSDRKKDRRNRHQEMRELLDSCNSETLRNNNRLDALNGQGRLETDDCKFLKKKIVEDEMSLLKAAENNLLKEITDFR